MSARDPLLLLEAAYSFVPSEEAWLNRIALALAPYSLSRGVMAYVSTLGETISMRTIVNHSQEDTDEARKVVVHQPPWLYRRVHAPAPLSAARETFPAIAQEFGFDLGRVLADAPYRLPQAMWALCGGDVGVESVLVTFPCKPEEAFTKRDRHTLDCFAAHLGSALRLRSMLREAPTGDEASVDAVLSPDGRVLDARGDARQEETRAPLLDAVRRSEKAKLRGATSEERLDVWTALVEGRWSILEHVERDGKRILLACRNEPRTGAVRRLTPREQSVVTYAALGHSFKYIAYELGIALPTAAAALEVALRKLGLTSRAELISLFARGSLE